MIDSSEKCIGWLNLELQSPDVIERRSKDTFLCGSVYFKHPIVLHPVMIFKICYAGPSHLLLLQDGMFLVRNICVLVTLILSLILS